MRGPGFICSIPKKQVVTTPNCTEFSATFGNRDNGHCNHRTNSGALGKAAARVPPLDVSEIAADMLRLVSADARRRGITLQSELTYALPLIKADKVCLQQVILNLLVNAMDAMDQTENSPRLLTVYTRHEGNAVEIAVSDTGGGIPADLMPKLFDAFFTTKREGIGLGLAIAHSIVDTHGGRIWAENTARGATFSFSLPIWCRDRKSRTPDRCRKSNGHALPCAVTHPG